MTAWPRTSASLLLQLRDGDDQQVWDDFLKLYRPAVFRFARRMGLQDADADDATQRVLESVAQAFQNRPPDLARGRFRSWIAQVTRNAALKLIERNHRHRGSGDSDVLNMLHDVAAAESSAEQTWLHEERLAVYRAAAAEVRANCTATVWAAFEQTTVVGRSPERVAIELNISLGVVYASRSRILKRIRKIVDGGGFQCDHLKSED